MRRIPGRRLAVAMLTLALLGLVGVSTSEAHGPGPSITKAPFGTLADGTKVDVYTLTNSHRVEVKILTYGGILQSIKIPDHHHRFANVALGFDNLADYVAKSPYFGCITGRYANRIALSKFSLNGTTYQLPINNPPNSLHGGTVGFFFFNDTATTEKDNHSVALVLTFTSPD